MSRARGARVRDAPGEQGGRSPHRALRSKLPIFVFSTTHGKHRGAAGRTSKAARAVREATLHRPFRSRRSSKSGACRGACGARLGSRHGAHEREAVQKVTVTGAGTAAPHRGRQDRDVCGRGLAGADVHGDDVAARGPMALRGARADTPFGTPALMVVVVVAR